MTLVLAALLALSAPPLEQLAERLFPAERLNRAMGFFAPVVKQYQPVFDRFAVEYTMAPDKMVVVSRYLPEADRALAAARSMKVPAKYEKEKAEYVRLFGALVASAKIAVRLCGAGNASQRPSPGPKPKPKPPPDRPKPKR